jgi:DNA-binding response OmpR family regulator
MQPDASPSILLVDDSPENLLAMEAILADLGLNLVKAASGREALKQVLKREFAAVLLDVQMPDLDGFETARLIRSRERSCRTPIVMLTAINTSDEHVARGYAAGAVDYLIKPFAPEVLRAKVTTFVELARKADELKQGIAQRDQAEAEIRKLNRELEHRVRERTADLEAEVARRQRAEEVQRFLAEAATVLASSLDYDATLRTVTRLAIPILADFTVFDVLEEGRVRRAACAHADPGQQELLDEVRQHVPALTSRSHPVAQAVASGQPVVVSRVDEGWMLACSTSLEHLQLMRDLNLRSLVAVPLMARGRTLGVLTLCRTDVDRAHSQPDLRLAEELARRAALAVDNARLYSELQEVDQRKDQFLAMLAHELRNPLAAITNAIELMYRHPPNSPTYLRAQ